MWKHLLTVLVAVLTLGCASNCALPHPTDGQLRMLTGIYPEGTYVDPRPANTLNFLYDNLEVEFAWCAKGHRHGGSWHVTEVVLPAILYADSDDIRHTGCDDAIGFGHSHPSGNCIMSGTDIISYAGSDVPLNFLICSQGILVTDDKGHIHISLENGRLEKVRVTQWYGKVW